MFGNCEVFYCFTGLKRFSMDGNSIRNCECLDLGCKIENCEFKVRECRKEKRIKRSENVKRLERKKKTKTNEMKKSEQELCSLQD